MKLDLKTMCDLIIEKRYVIAIAALILLTILGCFNMKFSFVSNFKIIALILITFELFQIITNKKKYMSLVGSILISASSFIAWWGASDLIIFGELAIIATEKFMKADKTKFKIVWSLTFACSIIFYVCTFDIAWMISFGYIFLALFIWIVLKNAKEYKFKKMDLLYIVLVIGIIFLFLTRFYIVSADASNSLYLGEENISGGKGITYLFSYAYSFMLPFVQTEDNMLYASMFSLFPIPLIMGIMYIYKKENHIKFILPMLIVLVFESIWCMTGFPEVLSRISLFNMVPVQRCAIAVALGSIYLYMYMISNIEESFISLKTSIKITLAVLVLFFCIDRPDVLENNKGYMYLFAMILTMGYFLLLNSNNKKYTKLFLGFAVIFTLVSGLFVI